MKSRWSETLLYPLCWLPFLALPNLHADKAGRRVFKESWYKKKYQRLID